MTREEQKARANERLAEYWSKKDAKPTNADRIRAMTDEELATIIFTGCVCTERFFKTESELLDWLKHEVAK